MKRNKLIAISFFISCFVYSQTKVNSSVKEYMNNSLWAQVFNDFDVKLTIPIVTPWIMGFGTYNYINNDVFTKNVLKEYDVFSGKNMELRELTNAINTSFMNFIPTDSTLRMRAMYKNRVLYTYDISQTDSTFLVDFSTPSKNNGETILFDKNGSLRTLKSFNNFESTNIESHRISDSLSICSTSLSESANTLIEKRQFQNGILTQKTTYKKDKTSFKESFVSDIIYKYDKESKLLSTMNLDKKGIVTDSVSYYYDADKLIMILQASKNTTDKRIIYNYKTKDTVEKEFNIFDKKYSISFISSANRLSELIFDEIVYSESSVFDFQYNTQGLLITVSNYTSINDKELKIAPRKQFIFGYNGDRNLKNVKVIDRHGIITKEINFEYDYL